MTPLECKQAIERTATRLEEKAAKGEIRETWIEVMLRQEARAAAWHNAVPELWRSYMPERYRGW